MADSIFDKAVKDMTKEEIEAHILALREAAAAKRRRSPYTLDGIKAGTTEYWRRYRAANKEKMQMHQAKWRAKVKREEVAATIQRQEGVSPEEAARMAKEEIAAAVAVKRERNATHSGSQEPTEFITQLADELGVPPMKAQEMYDQADSLAEWEEKMKDYSTELLLAQMGSKQKEG